MIEIKGERVPIYVFSDEIIEEAVSQAKNLSKLPFVYSHIALMPDYHKGYGVPIGSVFASKEYVIPYAVGVDIGCGVRSFKFNVSYKKFLENYKKIAEFILDEIPVGFSWHDKKVKSPIFKEAPLNSDVIKQEFENSKYQLGTLGGGNHFIEFQKDDEGFLYLTVHSGSRNLGKKTADYYHFKALKESENGELSYLSIRSLYGREYLSAMNYCVKFAKENRKIISDKIVSKTCKILNCEAEFIADVIHNYASFEKIDGKELVIHRKGAVKAYKNDILIIPGSMGSATYIAKGLGNKLSFYSASHGAGRKISRRQAKKSLDYDKIISDMKSKGILVYSKSKKGFLEEAPPVYKNIDEVLEQEKDLIKPVLKLTPVLVVKG